MLIDRFAKEEVLYGGKRELTKTFRLSRTLQGHLAAEAMSNRIDESTIIRAALHLYFDERDIDTFKPVGS